MRRSTVIDELNPAGNGSGSAPIAEDLESRLRRRQRIEALDRLAAGVSDHFLQLSASIQATSLRVLCGLSPDHPLRTALLEINKAAGQAGRLTRQIPRVARQEGPDVMLIDLNPLIEDLRPMLRGLLDIEIELDFALHPACGRIKARPGQVEQLLMNLVVNARDAMASGGRITVSTVNIRLANDLVHLHGVVPRGDYARLTVADTGCGMDGQTLARLFDPFFTTKHPGQGTGLGLTLVQGIARQNGGYVVVTSQAGRGSTFAVYLPCFAAAAERREAFMV
jgi:two-component system, cell cycle sensor histidine kinase and response regulator CckA